jgi:hypothetical protein
LGFYERIVDTKIAFAALQNLTILLQESINEHNGSLPDRRDFSPLHCLCKMAATANKVYIPSSTDALFEFRMPVDVPVASLLLRHGATVHAKYKGRTPWETLFQGSRTFYTKFGTPSDPEAAARVNVLAEHLLRAGQDPDADMQIMYSWNLEWHLEKAAHEPSGRFTVSKALHTATEEPAKLLLGFGANVNALDGEGRTALDLACMCYAIEERGQLDVEFKTELGNAYALAALLLRHGGWVTRKGQR